MKMVPLPVGAWPTAAALDRIKLLAAKSLHELLRVRRLLETIEHVGTYGQNHTKTANAPNNHAPTKTTFIASPKRSFSGFEATPPHSIAKPTF